MVESQIFFFTFIHNSASLHCFILQVSVIGVKNFIILDSTLQFSLEEYSLSLHFVELDTDRQALRMPIRIRQNDADPSHPDPKPLL